MGFREYLAESSKTLHESYTNQVESSDRAKAEKLMKSAVKELAASAKVHGYEILEQTKTRGAYGADNMIIPHFYFRLIRLDRIKSVGSPYQYVKLAFGIYAEDGEFTLVSYGSKKDKSWEQEILDKIVYEIGKRIKVDDAVGPTDHHYTIDDIF